MPGEEYYSEDAVVNGAAEDDQQRDEKLKPGVDVSVVSKWEAFFQGTEYMQKVRGPPGPRSSVSPPRRP